MLCTRYHPLAVISFMLSYTAHHATNYMPTRDYIHNLLSHTSSSNTFTISANHLYCLPNTDFNAMMYPPLSSLPANQTAQHYTLPDERVGRWETVASRQDKTLSARLMGKPQLGGATAKECFTRHYHLLGCIKLCL